MSLLVINRSLIRSNMKRKGLLMANKVKARMLAIESKTTTKPKSLDDIYTKVASPKSLNLDDKIYASSSQDGILTRVNADVIQTWNLFEACLESRDFERADLMLQNLANSKNSSEEPYFLDSVSEFLKTWGSEDSVTMSEIRRWLNYVCSLNSKFKPDARTYAWLIKLSFDKSQGINDINNLLFEYRMLNRGNNNSEILRYVDIIGLLNIKKLVDDQPQLVEQLPGDYRELFSALAEESHSNSHEEALNIENEIKMVEDIKLESNENDEKKLKEPINQVIDNKMETLKAVTSQNLKNIRHSLLGLADSYNDGEFLKKMIQLIELEQLDIDTKKLAENTEGVINLFELKNSLPKEQHDKFDEILDDISDMRERILEHTTLEAAKLKWEREFENIKDKSMPSSIGAYLHDWFVKLTPLIVNEVNEYKKARELLGINEKKSDLSKEEILKYNYKLSYGPFLSLLKPEKLATITILEVMKNIVTSDVTRGVPVSRLVMNIGKSAELEYKSEKILASNIDVHKNFKAIKNTPEFKKFLRTSKATQLIDRAEKNTFKENNVESAISASSHWDADARCKVGSLLLTFLLQVAKVDVKGVDPRTGITKNAIAPTFYHTYDFQSGGKIGVIKLNQGFASKLGNERLDQSIQAQHLPMVSRPKPWTSFDDGGYFLKKSTVLRAKNAPEQTAYARAAAINGKIDRVLQGLNNLANTPWTINKTLLELVTKVWNTGESFLEIPKSEEELVLPPPPPKGCEPIEVFRYRRACTELCNAFAKDRSMRCDMNYKLEIARAFVGERIFFPHSLDFRGRAYPIPPNFNHLGNDMSRSLLKFWKGKELGYDGLRWLKIHLSNLMGKDKISLDERVQYIDENIEKIRESVKDPLHGKGWWKEADKPWQFLAAAIELVEALELPDPTKYLSFQPVHQDGTCNGLQHYAALGGDIEGARQVNLIPSERPSDVYTHVSKLVLKSVETDAAQNVEEAIYTLPIISRKLVKQTVMTSVYGVTYVGARAQITKRLKEIDFDEDLTSKCSRYLTDKVFKAIRELFDGAHAIQDWFAIAARRISKSVRLDVEPDDDAEFLSSVIWTSPLGLPVVQPYRAVKTRIVKTNMQNFAIQDPFGVKNVDSRKQVNGFPPNFIHSLDATHMLLSVNRCSEFGMSFSSVHDSYWTHACDVDTMNTVLREEFIRLHQNNLVEKLKGEFERRYEGFLMVITVEKTSAVASQVRKYRTELGKKLGRASKLSDEIKIERERRTLLASSDPADVELGKQLRTCVTVLDEIDYKHGLIDNAGSYKILVPFELPEIPQKGSFDVSVVKDSPYFFS